MLLLTGATGFVGRNLCQVLVERGHQVRAFVRSTSRTDHLERLGVEVVWGDLQDAQALAYAAAGCRAVVHAAGKFRFWGEREEFFEVNVEGTRNVLAAAQRAGVERLIYISTVAVVGLPPPGATITEQTRCLPQDAYQESKLEAERLLLAGHRESGTPVVVLRPGAVYGKWSRYAFNRLFFEDPLGRLPVRVHGGRHITMPVYAPDVARAVELSLRRARPGRVYNVCGPCLSHRQVGETIEHLLGRRIRYLNAPGWAMVTLARGWTWLSRYTGREPVYPIGLYPYVFCDWRVDIDRARRELGFEPTSFLEGARETLAWYREQGILP